MTALFHTLLNDLVCYIETAIIDVLNLVVTALCAFIAAIMVILPNFPSISLPSALATSLDWGAYWFPLSWFFTELAVFVTLALTWFAISIALRWARAIRGNQ